MFSQWSGNGLVSYYSNIVFESVGIVETKTKAALNGGLQVRRAMEYRTYDHLTACDRYGT